MSVKKKIDQINPHRLAQANGRIGTKEVEVDGEKTRVLQMLDGHLLDYLLSRGQITSDQHRAGLMFYRDWHSSGISGVKAIDYSSIRVDTSMVKPRDHRSIDAMTRWNAAVKSLGRVLCHPVVTMILLEVSPERYGRERCRQNNEKLGRLAAITLLTASLEALHEHYTT